MKEEIEELRRGMVELGLEDRLYLHVKTGRYVFRLCDNAVMADSKKKMVIYQSCSSPFQVIVMEEEKFFDGRFKEDMSDEALENLKKLVDFRKPYHVKEI